MATRRAVLEAVAGAAAGVALPAPARFALAADAIGVVPVTDSLTVLTGAGGNVLVLSAGSAQVVVDSGAAEFTGPLLDALAGLPGGGHVETLFNTHWHRDQTGGNAAFGRAGARIAAHEKTRAHLATDHYLPLEERYEKALPPEAQPTMTFYTSGETTAGGERIEYGYLLEAHTDGDCYVRFRDSNVIAVGDAVSPLRDPVLDWFGGGWVGGRADSLALLVEISDAQTRFVPSFGPVVGRADVEAEQKMMEFLYEQIQEMVRKGMSADDIYETGLMDETGRQWSDPRQFLYDAHKGFWAHYNTLSPDVV